MNTRARTHSAQIACSLEVSLLLARAMATRPHRNLRAPTHRYAPGHVPVYLPLQPYRTYFDGFTDLVAPGARRAAARVRALWHAVCCAWPSSPTAAP